MTVQVVTAPINKKKRTTWWAHNPQIHRIETWLSCTPCCQSYPSCLTFYVIHGPPACWSILYRTQYLFLLPWTPFTLCSRQWTIAYSLENSYCTVLLCSRCVSFVQLERYSYVHTWETPSRFSLIKSYRCRSCTLPIHKYDGGPEERMTIDRGD